MRSEKFMPELVDHSDRLQMLIEGADTVRNEEYFADLTQAEVDIRRMNSLPLMPVSLIR